MFMLILSNSSTIIQQIKTKCDRGLALMGYYYFDFKDIAKQGIRGLLASLLSQFCATSDPCYEILSDLYSENHEGSQQPDNEALIETLKKFLRLPDVPMICIIVDAIDECPNTSGCLTAREEVLDLLEDLVGLGLPNLRICVTSRPEIDIRTVLEPSHHSTCPCMTKADKSKIFLITSSNLFTQTAECEDGGQRTSKWLLTRSRKKQMECG